MTRPEPSPRWRRLIDQALAAIEAGDSRSAPGLLEQSLRLNPRAAEAWRLMADVRAAAGDVPRALSALDAAARPAEARLARPLADLASGRLDEAGRSLASALAERASAPARALMGETLRRQGRLAEAARILGETLAEAPGDEAALRSQALTMFGARRFDEAWEAFAALIADRADDALALVLGASALSELGLHAEAEVLAAQLTDRFPDQTYPWLVRAGALRVVGETDHAILAWRRALALDPLCAEAWRGLADLDAYRFSLADRATLAAAAARDDLPPADRARFGYALSKALEDAADSGAGFEALAAAAAIERDLRPYDPDQTTLYVRRCRTLFTPAFFAGRSGYGAQDADPIFVVGLPRSGSTLVEQILASHPGIEATRELPDLPGLAQTVPGYPEGVARITRSQAAGLGAEYLRRTRSSRHTDKPRFVDKTPKNFLHIGLIPLILPNARIVDVRRHPLDCGLSIYRRHFGHGFAGGFDLGHIGRWYADYVALMDHFDAVQPGAVHRLIYEDLVADLEGETRRLLTFVGLPFDPACLRFFETRRPIDTPSAEQVRQPIFAGSIGRWRAYEPWLDPLKEGLGPTLESWRS